MIFDVIIIILLALAAFNGWRAGAIAMLLSLVVLVLAGLGASLLADKAGELLKIGPQWARPIVGFLFSFIVLMIAGGWIRRIFSPKHGILRGIDGLAGMLLGFVRATLILSILLAFLKLVHLPPEHMTDRSVLYPRFLKTSVVVVGVLRPYMHSSSINDRDTI